MSTRARAVCDQCGWVSKWTDTPARADYAGRRHSCAAHRERVARARRATKRETASGPARDCRHKIASHVHGTKAAYVLDRCRCRACRDAASAYERERERRIAYGTWAAYVDAQPVRDHLAALSAAGVGWKHAAHLAGLHASTVWKLLYGPPGRGPAKRCRRATRAALLAVPITRDALAPSAVVDPTGTTRRLQALVAVGWSQSKLAEHLGILPSNIGPLVHGKRRTTAGTARAVAALYDALWDTAPPDDTHRDRIATSRARRYARNAGWVLPAAWDDDLIDDPHATPVTGPDTAHSSRRVHIDDVEWLVDVGSTWADLPSRLGVTRNSIEQALARAERTDLLARLNRGRAA